jgi:hypothetical protein
VFRSRPGEHKEEINFINNIVEKELNILQNQPHQEGMVRGNEEAENMVSSEISQNWNDLERKVKKNGYNVKKFLAN